MKQQLNQPLVYLDRCFQIQDDIKGFGDNLSADALKNRDLYDQYAQKYDLIQEVTGFNDPYMIAQYLLNQQGERLPKSIKIIEFGCGTGILGQILSDLGYSDIVGVDGSEAMLKVAKARRNSQSDRAVYGELYQHLIGVDDLGSLPQTKFDVAVSSACMIKGHFPNNCFDTFLYCLKQKDGEFIFSIREKYLNSKQDSGMNYHGALDDREFSTKVITKIDKIPFTKYKGLNEFGVGYCEEPAYIMVYKKN